MKRRDFPKSMIALGVGTQAVLGSKPLFAQTEERSEFYMESARNLPIRRFDVVIAGGGTAGVIAAIAAARQGVKTALIELKGYVGGTATEGGTAIHSFYNLWKAFPGVEKRLVVRGIPQEMIDRLTRVGGASGYPEMLNRYDYDSVCTCVDVERYKLNAFEMLHEAGVFVCVNTRLVGAVKEGQRVIGVITESRSGREVFNAKSFVDCTAYGDLSAFSGAEYTEPNDYQVANSMGIGNVNIEKYYEFLTSRDAVDDYCLGPRSGKEQKIVRLGTLTAKLPKEFTQQASDIGMSTVTTTVFDDYFMFIKLNLKLPKSPTDRDEVSKAEFELRKRMFKGLELFRKYIPGCENAFIARTSPSLCIRRGRLISCDYDISHEDVIEARHFDDEVYVYGFHDSAPRLQIKNGGTYGIPYRAVCVSGIENLYVAGMMITSDHRAHMSTRNTVSCMAMGQATGTAAALCASKNIGSRDVKYPILRKTLEKSKVYFEV